jgi:ParB family chromosome partitioning protein
MTDDPNPATTQVRNIPIERIRVLNPRVRNRRNFQDIVGSIAQVGLKRPITVSARGEPGSETYDLVCGQGRVEAFMQLGQTTIPAIVIDAQEAECLVMSLVENCARRQHRAIDLLQDVGTLRKRGYNDAQIAQKIGVTPEYVREIAQLIENGEERLLTAVEAGVIPLTLAMEISKSDDEGIQRALAQAYTEKKLRGKKLVVVRRIIEQRRRRGRHLHDNFYGRKDGAKRPLTSEALMRAYRQEADRQKIMIKKAEVTQSRLLFIVEALRTLRSDEGFVNLLRAERLDKMPTYLQEQLAGVSVS